MGTNEEKIEHAFSYCGSHGSECQHQSDENPISPSAGRAQAIALSVLGGDKGRYRLTKHCCERMAEREFSVLDMEYVIRNGKCIQEGVFIPNLRQHKYTFRGNIDGTQFDAAFALSADHDLVEDPLLVLISGCYKNRTGKRKRTF